MERAAAKAAFNEFVGESNPTANQMEFLNLVIDHLTESGFVEPKRFYESPYTDFDDMGIAGVFSAEQAKRIIQIVKRLNATAAA